MQYIFFFLVGVAGFIVINSARHDVNGDSIPLRVAGWFLVAYAVFGFFS